MRSLLAVIASPAHWSMASLPRGLKPEEVDRLLNSFTDALPSPRRDYAVVRLALGIRPAKSPCYPNIHVRGAREVTLFACCALGGRGQPDNER